VPLDGIRAHACGLAKPKLIVPDDKTSQRTRRRDLIDQFCDCHGGPCRLSGITQNGGYVRASIMHRCHTE
jgi:hypothetical protein